MRRALHGSSALARELPRVGVCAAIAAAIALVVLSSCARSDGTASASSDSTAAPPKDTLPPVLVLAASDLQQALPRIVDLFEAKTGIQVEVAFGSTGSLETQIENGAPADLFLAASGTFVDRLEKAGFVRAGTRRVYAEGMLAITWREGIPGVDSIQSLRDPIYKTIAIANPEHAPYGALAQYALDVSGVLDVVRPRLVFGENVSQTLQMVETGDADAAIVSLANVHGRSTRFHEIRWNAHAADLPGGGFKPMYEPLQQTGVVIAGAARPEDAKRLLDYLGTREGWSVLAGYGFHRPANVVVDSNGNFVPAPAQP